MRNVKEDWSSMSTMLEELCSTQVIRSGALGSIYAVVDELRAGHGSPKRTRLAEKISVAILRLELSRRRRDASAEAAIRADIEQLSASWAELGEASEIPNQIETSWVDREGLARAS